MIYAFRGEFQPIHFHETTLSLHVNLVENFLVQVHHPTLLEGRFLHRQLQDFLWDIAPSNGFPVIAFDQDSAESEVKFEYDDFTGTLSNNKFLASKFYQEDSGTLADESLVFQ